MEIISKISKETSPESVVQELTQDLHGDFDLGLLFLSLHNTQNVSRIRDLLNEKIHIRNFLGCSCSGIVGRNSEIEGGTGCSLILFKFPEVKIKPFHFTQEQIEQLKDPEDWFEIFGVFPDGKPNFIIFPDPFSMDINQFLTGFNKAYTQSPVVGG